MESSKRIEKSMMNVLGEPLEICNCNPMTGWFRDGFCKASSSDPGQHTVCCVMSKPFLTYSKAQGNDLTTPVPEFNFPGINAGDHWCLCASRWMQAYLDGMAPLVYLEATDISALKVIGLELLMQHRFQD